MNTLSFEKIEQIAENMATMFSKAHSKAIKLGFINSQRQRFSEYYANGDLSEEVYRALIDKLDQRERMVKDQFNTYVMEKFPQLAFTSNSNKIKKGDKENEQVCIEH